MTLVLDRQGCFILLLTSGVKNELESKLLEWGGAGYKTQHLWTSAGRGEGSWG